jgi:hypothetical protein
MKIRSAYTPTALTKAYYTLNGNSVDISGRGNNGTDSSITYVPGKFDKGALFDLNGLITLPNLSLGTGDFTYAFTVNPSAFTTNRRFFLSQDNAGPTYNQMEVNTNNTTSTPLYVNHYNGTTDVGFGVDNTVFRLNSWNICVVTRVNDTMYIYVNGVLRNQQTGYAGRNFGGASYQTIGFPGSNSFAGIMDEVIIEARAWSASEVSTYSRKSMLNYGFKKSTLGAVFDLVLTALKGTFALTGKNVTFNTTLKAQTGVFSLLGKAINFLFQGVSWTNETKASSTWTNSTKASSTFTNQSKSSSTWTNQDKS